LVSATHTPWVVNDLSIEPKFTDEPRWKAGVFGSIVGILLVIGGVHVWEDAQARLKRQQTGDTRT
jgi:hypothetical protein